MVTHPAAGLYEAGQGGSAASPRAAAQALSFLWHCQWSPPPVVSSVIRVALGAPVGFWEEGWGFSAGWCSCCFAEIRQGPGRLLPVAYW